MRFPDFIIIGGVKCGTTALWFNLDKHPDISMAMPTDKDGIEMNFWRKANFRKGVDWYKSRFNSNVKLVGEKSAGYSASKGSMVAIKNHIPDVKLIYCIRNPVDRSWSNYQMNLKSKKVPNDFWATGSRYHSGSKYIHWLNTCILPNFSRDQLHIVVMERMKNNTTEEMRKVFHFLEVEDLNYKTKDVGVFDKTIEHINKSRKQKFYRSWSLQKALKNKTFYQKLSLRLKDKLSTIEKDLF
jgi:hypothetical protein